MIVTRSIEFPMGHRLKDHDGLCRCIHGHNYKVVVAVYARDLDDQGMVIDFSDLGREMKDIFGKYDHAFVFQYNDPLYNAFLMEGIIGRHHEFGLDRTLEMQDPPTAEHLARMWFHSLDNVIGDDHRHMKVISVTVHESTTTSAQYNRPGDYE